MGGEDAQYKTKVMDTNEIHIFTLSAQYFIILQMQKKRHSGIYFHEGMSTE